MSQITSHILDTSVGKPIAGVKISLCRDTDSSWSEVAWGVTNMEGRLTDLLPTDTTLPQAIYRLRFEIKDYYDSKGTSTFYPYVDIIVDITSDEHYHIPLLLNPFGYTTYRGS